MVHPHGIIEPIKENVEVYNDYFEVYRDTFLALRDAKAYDKLNQVRMKHW